MSSFEYINLAYKNARRHHITSHVDNNESPHLDCEHPINSIHSNLGNSDKPNFEEFQVIIHFKLSCYCYQWKC